MQEEKSFSSIKAKKSLGQNFLHDEETLNTIAGFFPFTGRNVIEVGPGYGALTEKLMTQNPASLTLIELDSDMVKILSERKEKGGFSSHIPLQILHQDVLCFYPEEKDYFLIANIPYYITSPIIKHFLYEVENTPEKMLLLMQKEVAEKILGKGKEKSSVLSLFIEKKARVEAVISVPKQYFRPIPKVDSFVLAFYKEEKLNDICDKEFLDFIKDAFREPRKKLLNNLTKSGYKKEEILVVFSTLGKDENVRAEDLHLEEYGELIRKLRKK